jgi:hypothetical protein
MTPDVRLYVYDTRWIAGVVAEAVAKYREEANRENARPGDPDSLHDHGIVARPAGTPVLR